MTRCLSASGALACILLGLAGCKDNTFQAPPPPAVTVSNPAQRDVIEYAELTGTTEVGTSIDVRARVSGILQDVRYEPGTRVRAGDPLFLIDPEPFLAARDALQAQVESAEAQLRLAQTSAERIENSARDGALSELQALEARAKADVAEAALKVTQKQLDIRQLDVDYTEISAPISGTIKKSDFSEGDLVGNSPESSLLTTIYDDTTIKVYFTVPDRVYLGAFRAEDPMATAPEVEIATEIDEGYPFRGTIDYADPTVDESTGTVRVRAVVDNADGRLLGGLFVRIRLPLRTLESALLVPQAAISTDQVGAYVLVVGDGNEVERRDIELGPIEGTDRVVLAGLSPQDRVVVRGLLRARPGATVTPQPSGS